MRKKVSKFSFIIHFYTLSPQHVMVFSEDKSWLGRIRKPLLKKSAKKKSHQLRISFWRIQDIESAAEDWDIPLEEFIVDCIFGDISFLE